MQSRKHIPYRDSRFGGGVMRYFKNIENSFIVTLSTNYGLTEITEAEYKNIMAIIPTAPAAYEGYAYMLRADTLEWELVELPPAPETEPEPTEEEALTRYANELTGKNDPDLVSATETLITKFTEE